MPWDKATSSLTCMQCPSFFLSLFVLNFNVPVFSFPHRAFSFVLLHSFLPIPYYSLSAFPSTLKILLSFQQQTLVVIHPIKGHPWIKDNLLIWTLDQNSLCNVITIVFWKSIHGRCTLHVHIHTNIWLLRRHPPTQYHQHILIPLWLHWMKSLFSPWISLKADQLLKMGAGFRKKCGWLFTRWMQDIVGKREQVACILATEEKLRYQKLLTVSRVTIVVGSLWCTLLATV